MSTTPDPPGPPIRPEDPPSPAPVPTSGSSTRRLETGEAASKEKLPFDLQADEHVVAVVRRHKVFMYWQVGWRAVAGIVPAILVAWLVSATTGFDGTTGTVATVIILGWLVYWGVRTYLAYYQYQHALWVVTSQRLIDSARKHWFDHTMASADLVNVEDMTIEKKGILATSFNYGNLLCQTAGQRDNFLLAGVPEPSKVLAIVDAHRDEARRDLARTQGGTVTTLQ